MPALESKNFPNRFQQESLKLIGHLIELTSSAFYLISPNMQHKGLVVHNMQAQADKEYERNYMDSDPLNPGRFEAGGETVVYVDELLSKAHIESLPIYREFWKPRNYRYVADMFFRQDAKIIAVITLLRSETLGGFSQDELSLLRSIQPFLEYTLNMVYMPARITERKAIKNKYRLTDREVDVLESLISGASNKEAAEQLGLSLATIKTHLHHIFQKTGVNSRTEMLSRIIVELKH